MKVWRNFKFNGKIFFALNPEGRGGRYYDDALRDFFIERGAQLERERIFFPAKN